MKWVIGAVAGAMAIVVIGIAVLATMTLMMGGSTMMFATPCVGQSSVIPANGSIAGQTRGLDEKRAAYAREVIRAGRQMGISDYGIVIALATVAQESNFQMWANDGTGRLKADQGGVVESLSYPHDRVGNDHGSVGLFQQQFPWWGSLAQLMDPGESARIFYAKLVQVPGWEGLPVTVAAQKVQKSAFPGAYAKHEPLARALLVQHGADIEGGGDTGDWRFSTADLQCGNGVAMTCPTTTTIDGGLTPDATRVARCTKHNFGDFTMYGRAERPNNPNSDHPTGRAVDIMIKDWQRPAGKMQGNEIAGWLQANASKLGVKYIIWDAKVWRVSAPEKGWAQYRHPSGSSNPTLDHLDHIHVSVYGNSAGMAAGVVGLSGDWAYPVSPAAYRVSSGFGPRVSPGGIGSTFHRGTDMAASTGTPTFAACTGVVTYAAARGGFGNYVEVDCGGGVTTGYAHLSAINVSVGQPVPAGTMVGAIGSTGNSTGPHLHFEVRRGGAAVDPVPWMANVGVDIVGAGRRA